MRRGIIILGSLLLVACAADSAGVPASSPAVVATVTVSPSTAAVQVGATATLTAVARDQAGGAITGRAVTWLSASPAIATVSAAGQVTGVAPGTASISATIDGRSGSATVTVSAAPGGPTGEFQTSVPPIDFNVIAGRPTASSVALSLYSASSRQVTVALPSEGRTLTATLAAGEPQVLDVQGLGADRLYSYQVTGNGVSFVGRFHTARARGTSFRFDLQADSHLDANTDPAIYTSTLGNMVADSADFLVDLGDTFMSDKFADFRDAAPMYYAQRHYLGIPGRVMPLFLVQGNHDGELGWLPANAAWAAGQRTRWFPQVAADAFYRSSGTPRNHYAWTWGDATFIVLDPYTATTTQASRAGTSWAWTLGREQYDWLAATLRGITTPDTFVFLHHLVGGKGFEARGGAEASLGFEWGGANLDGSPGFAVQRPGWGAPIHDVLVAAGVSAVFHGHDHLYVNQLRDGIRYQEVPQPSFARENATGSAADYGYVSGVLLGSSGHVRVTVTPGRATVEYVRSRVGSGNGAVVDRYDILPTVRP